MLTEVRGNIIDVPKEESIQVLLTNKRGQKMSKLNYTVAVAAVTVALTHKDGDEVVTDVSQDFSLDGLPESFGEGDNQRSLAAYGLSSLLQDRTSGIKDPKERIEKMGELMEQLKAGIWRSVKAAGERKTKIGADLVEAVKRYLASTKVTVTTEQVAAKLESMTKEQRKAMAGHPSVAAFRAIYKAELAKAQQKEDGGEGVDLAGLFASAGESEEVKA